MLLSNTVPSSSRPVYWMSVTSLAVGGVPSPSFSTLKPRPEGVRWKTCAEVPTQATATPIPTSNSSASQSLTIEPLGSGRSGTAVTDMGHPQNAKGGEPYRRPARKQAVSRGTGECVSRGDSARCAAAVALGALAFELAGPADRRSALAGALL